jgi:uncharacterized LabA/DUF88 family protein
VNARQPIERVVAYIDGFNLYFGLRESGLRDCYWLNLVRLAENLLRPGQELVSTKYFTARISGGLAGDPAGRRKAMDAKRKRQSDYLEALGTLPGFQMYEGHYLGKPVRCRSCGSSWRTHEEKMTDVQIATELLLDGLNGRFDTALILSADSDLVPPIHAVRKQFRDKRIVVGFPPGRASVQLKRAAHATFTIGPEVLRQSVFPERVPKPDGFVLRRPPQWQ